MPANLYCLISDNRGTIGCNGLHKAVLYSAAEAHRVIWKSTATCCNALTALSWCPHNWNKTEIRFCFGSTIFFYFGHCTICEIKRRFISMVRALVNWSHMWNKTWNITQKMKRVREIQRWNVSASRKSPNVRMLSIAVNQQSTRSVCSRDLSVLALQRTWK